MKRGPKPGYKQTPEHIEKRKMWGANNPAWLGDKASRSAGHARAVLAFPAPACSGCGATRAERHHIDQNPLNNSPENVAILCRKCHKAAHRLLPSRRALAMLHRLSCEGPPCSCEWLVVRG